MERSTEGGGNATVVVWVFTAVTTIVDVEGVVLESSEPGAGTKDVDRVCKEEL